MDEEVVEVKRERKPNFSAAEVSVLTDQVEKNLEVIQSKLTNNITNKKKNKIWEEITAAVNAVANSKRTTQEIKDKWKNLTCKAKREYSTLKRARKETGGGPQPKQPSEATERIINIYEDTPSFSGLNGFDSGKICKLFIMWLYRHAPYNPSRVDRHVYTVFVQYSTLKLIIYHYSSSIQEKDKWRWYFIYFFWI